MVGLASLRCVSVHPAVTTRALDAPLRSVRGCGQAACAASLRLVALRSPLECNKTSSSMKESAVWCAKNEVAIKRHCFLLYYSLWR